MSEQRIFQIQFEGLIRLLAQNLCADTEAGSAPRISVEVDRAARVIRIASNGRVGTTAVLHVGPQDLSHLHTVRIKEIIRTCADFIGVPVYVNDEAEPANPVTAPWHRSYVAGELTPLEQAYATLFPDRKVTARTHRFEPVTLPAVLTDPLTLHLNAANPIIERLAARSDLGDEVSRSALQALYNNALMQLTHALPADSAQATFTQLNDAVDLMLRLAEQVEREPGQDDPTPEPAPTYLSCSVTLPEGEPRSEEIFAAVRSVLETKPYYWQVCRADSSPVDSDLPLDLDEPPAHAVLNVAVFAGPRLNPGLVNEVSISQILGQPQLILSDEGHPPLPPSFADVPQRTVRGLGPVLMEDVLSALAEHPEVRRRNRSREHVPYLSPSVLAWCEELDESAGAMISARYPTWPEFLAADSTEVARDAGIDVAVVEAAKSELRLLAEDD